MEEINIFVRHIVIKPSIIPKVDFSQIITYILTSKMISTSLPDTHNYRDFDDKVLIESSISGDKYAFSELINRYGDYLDTLLRKKFSLEKLDLQDILQNIFESLLKNNFAKLTSYKGESKFSTWLATVAIRCGYDYIRKMNKQTGRKIRDKGDNRVSVRKSEVYMDSTLERIIRNEEVKELKLYIDKLSSKQRLLLELKYYENKSYKEISKILNIPENTVASGLNRAIKKLKKFMGEI